MKRFAAPVLIALIFLVGGGFVLYPLVSNALYEKNQSRVLAQYDEAMEQVQQEQLDAEFQAAQEYNRSLLEGEVYLTDPFDPDLVQDPTEEPYSSLLNVEGDGMMGYVEIPKIDVYLPVYHGTTKNVLETGVGHLQNTSLPVGGESTHAVLTGHTGLSGKRLFTDLSQLVVEDVFYIHVLGQVLAYQVEQIYIVEPDDTEHLVVQQGRDLATLVTCHPYGINTHRLLVQGTRIPYEQALEQQQIQGDLSQGTSVWETEYRKAIIICLAVYIPLTTIVAFVLLRRRKKQSH
ncbi:class C sortase [Pseudoflavonifractor sp. An85]|uniref:class C sortase n=1 Tax=Pseudoflavonifractor sp. An85 TaxID=1965661 RepID=UPI000B38192D|nr:class C sortase [Pseudoflavonifractor sp. An85]OUN21451.1 hypothetical protein B5G37_11170 [Pseudoflavonifractor sp. An85]